MKKRGKKEQNSKNSFSIAKGTLSSSIIMQLKSSWENRLRSKIELEIRICSILLFIERNRCKTWKLLKSKLVEMRLLSFRNTTEMLQMRKLSMRRWLTNLSRMRILSNGRLEKPNGEERIKLVLTSWKTFTKTVSKQSFFHRSRKRKLNGSGNMSSIKMRPRSRDRMLPTKAKQWMMHCKGKPIRQTFSARWVSAIGQCAVTYKTKCMKKELPS